MMAFFFYDLSIVEASKIVFDDVVVYFRFPKLNTKIKDVKALNILKIISFFEKALYRFRRKRPSKVNTNNTHKIFS